MYVIPVRISPRFPVSIAVLMPLKLPQKWRKRESSGGPERGGRLYRSSSQKDVHWPVARDPMVGEVIDLRVFMMRRSWRAHFIVRSHPRLVQISSSVDPSIRSMMLYTFRSLVTILRIVGQGIPKL